MKKLMLLSLLSLAACNQGTDYITGPQGPQGSPGQNCSVTPVSPSSVAPNGGGLLTCPDSQLLILNGSNGTNGTNGQNGTNGSNGTNGTIVTPIQFCPGQTTYPSEFNEVGFCIGGNLYAVYSANDGFLSEIAPGAYSSDGINSSCNFTVGPNCQVSH